MMEEQIKKKVEAAILRASKELEERVNEAGHRFMRAWMRKNRV